MLNSVKIKQLISDRGLKINFLIDKMSYSNKTFYNYMNGITTAPEDFKLELADLLGIPVSMLD